MAHYILITEDADTTTVTHLEAKNRHAAARQFFDDPNSPEVDEATLFRVAAAPVKVRVRTVTETKVEVE